jgi:hypothetical protein
MTWRTYFRIVANLFLTVVATIVIANVLRPPGAGEPSTLVFAFVLGFQIFLALMLRDIANGIDRAG